MKPIAGLHNTPQNLIRDQTHTQLRINSEAIVENIVANINAAEGKENEG